MRKILIDDGSFPYLTEGADLVGAPGIPAMLDLKNTQIPRGLIPFEKIKKKGISKRQYVHFYMHDKFFLRVLTATKRYVNLLKEFDGVISPDCTLLVNQAPCIQQTNTYFNRAVGFFLQRQGIPVIPNIRWSDDRSYDYCFLGVPKNSIVSVSTHGCIDTAEMKELFRKGLKKMLEVLEPTDVLVHGRMPNVIFDEYKGMCRFHHYRSWLEQVHSKAGDNDGN